MGKRAKDKRRHTCKHIGFNSKCRECHRARQCSFKEFIMGSNRIRQHYINQRRGGFQTDIRDTLLGRGNEEEGGGRRGRDFQEEERIMRGRNNRGRG